MSAQDPIPPDEILTYTKSHPCPPESFYCLATTNAAKIVCPLSSDAKETNRKALMKGNCKIWLAALGLGAFLFLSSLAQTTDSPQEHHTLPRTGLLGS